MAELSIEEPVELLQEIPIVDNGEPLVSWLGHPRIFQDRPRFNYTRETVARQSVVEFLWRAADALPEGYKLAIIEGWRPPYIQRRMYNWSYTRFKKMHPEWSEEELHRLTCQFTAPMDAKVPPPHTTGGAVDLVLADIHGNHMDHTTPFEQRDHLCFPFAAPGLSDQARRTRDILGEAMSTGGLTNYPSEYWHWSYGDQGWAYRGELPNAVYDAVTPAGWEPHPGDDTDDPLTYWLDEPESAL